MVVEVISFSFESFEFEIFKFETSKSIESEASGSAGAIKIRSWNVWEFDSVFLSGKDGIDISFVSGEGKFSTLAPVLDWCPFSVNKEMFYDCDWHN